MVLVLVAGGCYAHIRMIIKEGEKRKAYKNLAGKPKQKRQFGKPMHRWNGNIEVNLKKGVFMVWPGFIRRRIETFVISVNFLMNCSYNISGIS
jgi:hypothetical protein